MVSLLPDSRRSPWRGGRLISHTRCPCLRRKRARPIPYEPVPSTPKATSRPPDRRTGPCASAPPAAPRRRARPEAWWSAAAGRWSRPHRRPGTPPRSPHRSPRAPPGRRRRRAPPCSPELRAGRTGSSYRLNSLVALLPSARIHRQHRGATGLSARSHDPHKIMSFFPRKIKEPTSPRPTAPSATGPPTPSTPSPWPDRCLDRHANQDVHDFARALGGDGETPRRCGRSRASAL